MNNNKHVWIYVAITIAALGVAIWYSTHAPVQPVTGTTTSGAGTEIAPGFTEHKFTCSDGALLSLVTSADPSVVGVAFLAADGTNAQETIPQVEAASGAKYEGYGLTVWNKGDEVTLTYVDKTYTCTAAPVMEDETPATQGTVDIESTL